MQLGITSIREWGHRTTLPVHFTSMICASCLRHWRHSEFLPNVVSHTCSRLCFVASRHGGFHFWDFLLGVLFSTAVLGFLYYRLRHTGLKALSRQRQSFAVRVRKDFIWHRSCDTDTYHAEPGLDMSVGSGCASASILAMQALKDMDSSTLKKVLGQVSAASLHDTTSRVTLCAVQCCSPLR